MDKAVNRVLEVAVDQYTAELLALNNLIHSKDTVAEDADLKDKIKQIMELTGCSQDKAEIVLYDCKNDMDKALNTVLEGATDESEWPKSGKKKKKQKPEPAPAPRLSRGRSRPDRAGDRLEQDDNEEDDNRDRGFERGRGRGRGFGPRRGWGGGGWFFGPNRRGFENENSQFDNGPQIDNWTNKTAVIGEKEPKTYSSGDMVPGKKTLPTASAGSENLQVYCQPCEEEGPRIPAYGYCTDCQEHLCETCFKVHKKHKLSKHHKLLDKESMPKNLQLSLTSDHTSMPDDFRTPCPKHKREMIKFYCHDHKTLLCSVCVTLEHTATSCKVNYIPDISAKIINSKEYHNILKVIDNITDQCHKKSEDVKKMTGNSNSSLADVLADIKTFRKEINQRLDELERQVEDAAKAIQQENAKNLKTTETTCDDVTKSLKTMSDSIKHLNTSKQADRLFMELKSAEKMIKYYENRIQHISAYDVQEYNFEPSEIISTFLKTESSLGTLTKKTNKQTRSPPAITSVKSRNTSHQGKLCVKTSTDKAKCMITEMTLLAPDTLIITDNSNYAVKMVDISSQSVTDQLKLAGAPSKVTPVTSTELAVTIPFKNMIQFISASSNKLTKKRILKVDGECFGISCHEKKLVVTYLRPAKLQILDISGTILTTVRGENIFTNPIFVTTNSSFIYVSDWKMKNIMRLNWQGEVTGSYGFMDEPRGIILSGDGTVFACDQHRNVIEEISGDCSNGKVMLKDLKDPYAVCWCNETKELYFSSYSRNESYDNYLHIFKLS